MPSIEKPQEVRRWILYLIFAALLIFADLWLLGRMSVLEEFSSGILLQYQEGTVAEKAFESMMDSDTKELFQTAAVWKSEGKAWIAAEGTGQTADLNIYGVKGQPEAVFGKTLYSGRYFQSGEESVCLLDQKAARALFGTERAVGNQITVNSDSFQVAGILTGDQSVCILPAERGMMFDGIAVSRKSSGQSVKTSISALEMYFGSARGTIDGQLFLSTANILFFLNLSVSLFLICVMSGRCSGGLLSLLLLAQGIRLSGLGSDYLPTYWSDFEFFGSLWKEKVAAIVRFSSHQEFWREQQVWKNWVLSVGGNLGVMMVLIVGTIIYITGKTGFSSDYNRKVH